MEKQVMTVEDIDRLENYIKVLEEKVKNRIEVPEIPVIISEDNKSITYGAIDKVKYATFLSKYKFIVQTTVQDVSEGTPNLISTNYIGDQVIHEAGNNLFSAFLSLQYL